MKRFYPGSFLAGAVLAGALTVGGLAIAQGDGDGERGGMMGRDGGGMMGGDGGGMMGMMSEMQEMMSRCNAMMDKMGEGGHGGGMMSPERQGGDES